MCGDVPAECLNLNLARRPGICIDHYHLKWSTLLASRNSGQCVGMFVIISYQRPTSCGQSTTASFNIVAQAVDKIAAPTT